MDLLQVREQKNHKLTALNTANSVEREIYRTKVENNVPSELQSLHQWVCWRTELKDDRYTKVPYIAGTNRKASSTDPGTWTSFDDALTAYMQADLHYAGVGFMLSADDPYTGIDFDGCISLATGREDASTLAKVRNLGGYAETSPSGTGIRVFVRAHLPGKGTNQSAKHNIEMYDQGRFLTITGQVLDGVDVSAPIPNSQEQVTALYTAITPAPKAPAPAPAKSIDKGDDELLQAMFRAKNGAAIQALYNGDTTAQDGDDSKADFALCSHLAFYTQDADQIDRMFRSSGLYRDKWDSRRGNTTYGAETIAKILDAPGANTYQSTNGTSARIIEDFVTPAPVPSVDASTPAPVPYKELDLRWVSEYTQLMTELTGSPAEFNRLAGLAIVATVLGRKFKLETTFGDIYPNIYGAIIAPSSVFHKSAALGKVAVMLSKAGFADSLLANQFTPEGLVRALAAQPIGLIVNDEIGRLFTSHKTKYLENLKPDLTAYYDGGIVKRQLSKDTITVNHPCLSIIGATTPKVFFEGVTGLDWQSGFLARWMFARPGTAEPDFEPGDFLDAGTISLQRSALPENKLATALEKIAAQAPATMNYEPGAYDCWRNWYKENMKAAYTFGDDKVIAFEQRATTYALKFAIMLTVMDASTVVTQGTMQTAIELAGHYTQVARQMMAEHQEWGVGGDKLQKVLRVINKLTEDKKEASTSVIQKAANMKKAELEPCLDALAKAGAVVREPRHPHGHVYIALVRQLQPRMVNGGEV